MAFRPGFILFVVPILLSSLTANSSSVRPPFRAIVGPVLIAERGGYREAPENTLASVRHSIAAQADWIHVDVTLSRDDKVVVIHDSTLERTTNGTGSVSKKRLRELQKLSAGSPELSQDTLAVLKKSKIKPLGFNEKYPKEKIPSLKQVLNAGDIRVMVELRPGAHPRRLAHGVIDLLNRASAWDRVAVASVDTELLSLAHNRDPTVALIGIAASREALENHLESPVSAVVISESLLAQAWEIIPPGVAIWIRTVRDLETASRLMNRGVHGMITDIPKKVVKHLRPQVDVHLKLSR
ncbi:MAG: hypothetical protein HOK97_02505 [Deltaproteobacteria bacterium]|jgi:glycerophosphoryl diester phosphodiesterase|nr:hypothetical protein [Deltaproteobacteria bacterium]MBT6488604.1 hypothetical protein [Deltaproteobacteria bacterium]